MNFHRIGIGKRIQITTKMRRGLHGKHGVVLRLAACVCPVIRLDGETKLRRIYIGDFAVLP